MSTCTLPGNGKEEPHLWEQRYPLVAGKPGARFDLEVEHVGGHAHLPIVRLRRAA